MSESQCPPHATVYELPDGKWRVVCGERRFTGTTKLAVAELGLTMQELTESNTRIAELEAIVAKLPKTADGAPVTIGMNVWLPRYGRDVAAVSLRVDEILVDGNIVTHNSLGRVGIPTPYYSTRAAAEAAEGQEAKESDNGNDPSD